MFSKKHKANRFSFLQLQHLAKHVDTGILTNSTFVPKKWNNTSDLYEYSYVLGYLESDLVDDEVYRIYTINITLAAFFFGVIWWCLSLTLELQQVPDYEKQMLAPHNLQHFIGAKFQKFNGNEDKGYDRTERFMKIWNNQSYLLLFNCI